MRSEKEIVLTHDILDGVLRKDSGMDLGIPSYIEEKIKYQCDVLCWILKHDNGTAFEDNVKQLLKLARQYGYELADLRPEWDHEHSN